MASSGVMAAMSELVGRGRECGVIGEFLVRAIGAEAGALVVRGEAGIGKTALLDHAAERAGTMIVLRATGVEAESDLAFSGVYGLVRPIVDKLDELPGVQGAALAGALGLAPSTDADRLLVSAALLGLLAAAAEDQPVLCVVDDAQWLDRPSADALVFAARRVRAERLAMLFGAREGESRRFEAAGVPELHVHALDVESARMLMSRRIGDGASGVRERLLAEAAGNPLALLELPSALSGEQLSGEAALPDAIPLTPRLQDIFRQRIERLPESARASLRIAAAEDTGDAGTVVGAMAQAQLPPSALDAAEHAALIRVAGGRISFRHPLVRSALWDAATLSERQSAHLTLAQALTGDEHADRRVWHQAKATLSANEEVAAALEVSARRSEARAAHSSAATAFLRAADLSVNEDRRSRRVAAAAQAAWDAGEPDRARQAITRALAGASGELKAKLLQLSGDVEARCGSVPKALTLFLEAADAADGSLKLEVLADAAEAAIFTGQIAKAVEVCERATQIPVTTARDRMLESLMLGFAKLFVGDYQAAQRLLGEMIRQAEALGDPRALTRAASAASVAGRPGEGLPIVNRAVDIARQMGLLSVLPTALQTQGYELMSNSSFDLAYAVAQEGYRLSIDAGHGHGWHLTTMATVEAVWGRESDSRNHSEELQALGQQSASTFLSGIGEWALGFLDLVMGRPDESATRMLAVTDLQRPEVNPLVAFPAIPDTVEAAVRSGRRDELGARLAALEAWAVSAPVQGRLALLARCQALVAARDQDDAFGEALARSDGLAPFERARTALLYGEWLRRKRRRQEARVNLRAALEMLRSLGAHPLAGRAEAELRATGETARKRDPSTLDDLTPQELQIAGLVAKGLTNKEIAARLFLSPRTIDYHLRKVFSKIGIASRTELVRDGLPARAQA